MARWLKQLLGHLEPDDSHPLPVRLFQLICATAAILCLLVILPINAFQNLPILVNVADAVLGLIAAYCYRASSRRGRHHFLLFFAILIVLLDPVWFLNAGSLGSLTYYFFPVMLYPLVVFRGRQRWILAGFLMVNVCGLLVLEYYRPGLTVPFQSPVDRLIDLTSGVVCSFLALVAIVWLILKNYEREQQRITRYSRELAVSEERLRLSLAASRQGWFELNVQTGAGLSSEEYVRMIGFDPAKFVTTQQGWLEGIHPDDREMVRREYLACLAAGDSRSLEYRRRTSSGGWKWIQSVGKIVEFDAAGKPLRMVGTHADITERKELEAQLLHGQRLESIGTLAAGVAHDLNNILTPILVGGSILRDKLADERDRDLMALMESGARRGAAIVRQLLTFSSDMEQGRVPVDPRQLVCEMADIMRTTSPREIEVVSRIEPGLWSVVGDPTQLHQVLMNLCLNARDAMPDGGTLTIAAENEEPGGDKSSRNPWGSSRVVRLSISDTGHGIPPEIRSRIFDPFFTTKGVGRGTGLGLSTVHGIVKAHGGTVTLESEPNRGSTFRVLLPASLAALPAEPVVSAPAAPVPSGRLILVLDDEATVLEATRRLLEKNGHQVVAAGRGADAVELLKERAGEVKLVITDMMMPEMDGMAVVPLLRAIVPTLRIIGVSGLNYEPQRTELAALGFSEMLQKPYDAPVLLAAVNRQLQAAAAENASDPGLHGQ